MGDNVGITVSVSNPVSFVSAKNGEINSNGWAKYRSIATESMLFAHFSLNNYKKLFGNPYENSYSVSFLIGQTNT